MTMRTALSFSRTLFAAVAAATVLSAGPAHCQPAALLNRPIAEFSVENVDMARFFSAFVHLTGVTGGLVVHTVPFDDNGQPMRHVSAITIRRTNVTPRDLLNEAVRQAPEYVWREESPRRIIVLPVREEKDPAAFVNTRVEAPRKKGLVLERTVAWLSRAAKDTDHPINKFMFVGYASTADAKRPVTFKDSDKTLLDVLARAFSSSGDDLVWVLHWNVLSCMKVMGDRIVPQALVDAEAAAGEPGAEWNTILDMFLEQLAQAPHDGLRTTIAYRLAAILQGGTFDRNEVHASLTGYLAKTDRPANLTDAVLVQWLLACEVAGNPTVTEANLRERLDAAPAHPGYRAALEAGIAWLDFVITNETNAGPAR